MSRRRWMRWGAVGAVAAVALSGCVGEDGPEPSPSSSPEPTLSDSELAAATEATYQAFLDELYAMYADFDDDYTRLTPYASDELATSSVADMAATHESGLNVSGTALVTNVVVAGPREIELCVDGSGIRVYDIESGVELAPGDTPLSAWSVSVTARGESVLIESRTPAPDGSATCDP